MPRTPLSIVLGLDALIAISFGVASGFWPLATFGTIVRLQPPEQHTATIAALTTVSLFYVLMGLVSLATLLLPRAAQPWFVLILCLRHLLSFVKGLMEAGAGWQIGSPVPDLVIHSVFGLAYLLCFIQLVRSEALYSRWYGSPRRIE
ncbi:MAG: hypothetical protein GQE15_31025 [Archangiaceae bacterium]|nr:hypothetical protein [Archangiaceae bacterium]